jgi:hypothetical protein
LRITGKCIGVTYYKRKCVLKKELNNLDFIEGVDYRRNTDTNFKINQNTCRWLLDEKVTKITDVGTWKDYKFIVEKSFEEHVYNNDKEVDLELVSQMSTAKNLSMTSSPTVIAERFMNSTNMGPFINYNRKDAVVNDVLNNSARFAHCIAMHMRWLQKDTDIYDQLFRRTDTIRLVSVGLLYSQFY